MNRIRLARKAGFRMIPSSPFNFDGTFNKPSHFDDGCSLWVPGRYWQAMRLGRRPFGIRIAESGTALRPKLYVSIYSDRSVSEGELERIRKELTWRFDLDADLREFDRLMRGDRRFGSIFKRWKGMRHSVSEDLYGTLIISVVLQNATIRRTVQMMHALLERYGTKVEFDGRSVWLIWRPERMGSASEEELRSLKVGYRAKFIKRLSEDFASGKVDEHRMRGADKDSAKRELMGLYGVGPETARIMLFNVCHQYDTFDHIAPWEQKIYSMLFYNRKLVPAKRIRDDINRAYGKYSMLAVHYIWEDVFWRRRNERIEWLEREIRL